MTSTSNSRMSNNKTAGLSTWISWPFEDYSIEKECLEHICLLCCYDPMLRSNVCFAGCGKFFPGKMDEYLDICKYARVLQFAHQSSAILLAYS